jgi:hypothetical protein
MMVSNSVCSVEEFIEAQKFINDYIKGELRFKFYSLENEELLLLEHFAIAVMNPRFND